MGWEDIKQLRAEIVEEIYQDVMKEMGSMKKGKLQWTEFKKQELLPLLSKRFNIYDSNKISACISSLLRFKYGKSSAICFKAEDMKKVKNFTYSMVEMLYDLRPDDISCEGDKR